MPEFGDIWLTFGSRLETLEQVDRMKAHGVGEDEVERCKLDILADLETAYLERDQIPSADHAAEAIEHFLRDERLIDLELELEMCKKMLKTISADEVGAQARLHDWGSNCLVTVRTPAAQASEDAPGAETEEEVLAVFVRLRHFHNSTPCTFSQKSIAG